MTEQLTTSETKEFRNYVKFCHLKYRTHTEFRHRAKNILIIRKLVARNTDQAQTRRLRVKLES